MANGPEGVRKTPPPSKAPMVQEGTAKHPIGRQPELEGRKGVTARNESVIGKDGKETVYRAYIPKNEQAFKDLKIDPKYAAIQTPTNQIVFMRNDASKAYLRSSQGIRASITSPEWRGGRMVKGEKDAFGSSQPSLAAMRKGKPAADKKPAATENLALAGLLRKGHLQRVVVPGGGRGYVIAAKKSEDRNTARSELINSEFSWRQTIKGREYWMNQETWQKVK